MHECDVYLISPALLWQNYTSVCWTCHRLSDSLHLRLCSRFPPLITRCPETPQSRLVYSAQSSLEGRMGTSAGCPAVVHSFLHLSPSHFFPSFVYFHLVLFSFSPAFRFFLFIPFQVLFLLFFVLIFLVFPLLSFSWLCVFLSFFLVCPCPSFFLIFLFLLFTNFFSFFTKFSIFPLLTPDFPFFHNIFDFLSSSGTFSSFFPIFCLHFLLPDLSLSFYSSWFFSVLFSPHSFLPIPSLFLSYSLDFLSIIFSYISNEVFSHSHAEAFIWKCAPWYALCVCLWSFKGHSSAKTSSAVPPSDLPSWQTWMSLLCLPSSSLLFFLHHNTSLSLGMMGYCCTCMCGCLALKTAGAWLFYSVWG